MPEDRPRHELGRPLLSAALAVAGVLFAMLAVYAGTGLHDGFGDWDLHRIGRRFRRILPWAVPLAAVSGLLLHACYARMLKPGVSALVMLFAIPRAFAHFPLYGMLGLLGVLWGLILATTHRLVRRFGSTAETRAAAQDSDSVLERWLGVPLWFIILPFSVMKLPNDGELELPETVSQRRLLRWMPAMFALLFLFTGAVSEESGERVDPYWLAAAASFWLADYLVVAIQVAPTLRARRTRSRTA